MSTVYNPAVWFEIYVQDMERAKRFYEITLGYTLSRLGNPDLEMWAFPSQPDRPGAGGTLVKLEGKESAVGGTIVYFTCDDCAVEAARCAENGGKVHRNKTSIGEYGFIALLLDTEGNMFGLHSLE